MMHLVADIVKHFTFDDVEIGKFETGVSWWYHSAIEKSKHLNITWEMYSKNNKEFRNAFKGLILLWIVFTLSMWALFDFILDLNEYLPCT